MRLVDIVVVALAAYRLARVPTQDALTHEWRQAVTRWAWRDDGGEMVPRAGSWRTYVWSLIADCPLCLGFWIALGLWALWSEVPDARWVISAVAVAGAQCFLAVKER